MSEDKIRFWEQDGFQGKVGNTTKMAEFIEQPKLKRRREDSFSVHPLMIDHVIEKVLSYCEFHSAVKQFRLVCKQWNEIATNKYRNNCGRICFENDFNRKTAKFIQVMRKSRNIPFDKFKFSGGFVVYKPYNGQFSYDTIFNELFRTCVPSMKIMEFTSHNPSDLKFPKDLKSFDLSELTTLSFHICVFYESLQMDMPEYLGAILDASTNLVNLDFRVDSVDPSLRNEAQLQLMLKFGDVLVSKLPKSCKHLKLNMLMNEEQMELFEKLGLQLESLIIDFPKIPFPLSSKMFEKFLQSQSQTLQYLELIECPLHLETTNLPVLPNLTQFRIEGKPLMPVFQLGTVFPKLKNIEILFYWIYQDENWLKDIFTENGCSHSVNEVDFLCEINDSDSSVFYRMVKCFPKMQRMNVVVNSVKALSTIFSALTFLEDFEMSLSREFWQFHGLGRVDEAFCGIPAEQCVLLLKESSFTDTELPTTLKDQSLRDLKKLKKLKIRGFRADNILLTDVTVHFGFLKMDSLEELTLDAFPISKQGLKTLEKRVNLTLLPGPPTLP